MNSALIVLPSGEKGGAEGVSALLAEELAHRGWSVTVYSMCRGDQPLLHRLRRLRGVTVVAGDYRRELVSILPAIAFISKLCRKERLDLCFSTHLHVNALLGLLRTGRILRVSKVVFRESTSTFRRFIGWRRFVFYILYRVGYGRQDLLIFQTVGMKNSLVRTLPEHATVNACVLRNPVVANYMKSVGTGSPKRLKKVVACGRLVEVKGFTNLIEAFFSVSESVREGWVLEIVGEGSQRSALEAQIKRCFLEGRVFLRGQVENPAEIYSEAQVGVVSSISEGFPNVLLEMMAAGVPNIVTTPCFDGYDEIPGLILSRGMHPGDIAEALALAISSNNDQSQTFLAYVREAHSLRDFTDAVVAAPI